jgi:activating signal cointegrator 1
MKALTICQPYAHLIAVGRKRVENRTWPTSYRGPIYIHAGKSRQWLSSDDPNPDPRENYGIPLADMAFGAVVAFAHLTDCVNYDDLFEPEGKRWNEKYPWLRSHEHTEGPWCWVFSGVRRVKPVEYRGAQGLWDCQALTESYVTDNFSPHSNQETTIGDKHG